MNETKFDGMGKIYAGFRPAYPKEFIDYLYTNVGITTQSVIADIGSGTGILTKQLLLKGSTVYAVEPNDDMRKTAEQSLCGYKNFVSVCGTAENTTLADQSIDFITVAQAFHWFDREDFKIECNRILKLGGKIVLVWNSRDKNSKLVKENDKVNRKYCPNFKGFSGNMRGATGEDDFMDFFEGSYECKVFGNDQLSDKDGFVGRNLSASYAPKKDDIYYHDYVNALKELFEPYSDNGTLVLPLFTRSYVGKV